MDAGNTSDGDTSSALSSLPRFISFCWGVLTTLRCSLYVFSLIQSHSGNRIRHCAEQRRKKRWQLPNTHLRKEGRLRWQDLGKNSQNRAGIYLLLSLPMHICHFLMVCSPQKLLTQPEDIILRLFLLLVCTYFFLEVELTKAMFAFVTWTTANTFQTVVVYPGRLSTTCSLPSFSPLPSRCPACALSGRREPDELPSPSKLLHDAIWHGITLWPI